MSSAPPPKHPLIQAAETEFDALLREDEEIEARRAALQQKLAVVSQTLDTLRRVYGEGDSGLGVFGELVNANLGISDQIRQILRSEYPVYLKPTTIRGYLDHHGFLKTKEGKDYENPLALVHQILRRLHVAKEIELQTMADGAKLYRWNPQQPLSARMAEAFMAHPAHMPAGQDPINTPSADPAQQMLRHLRGEKKK